MIFVDSSVWIDWFKRAPTPECVLLDSFIGEERVVVGDLVLTETLQGAISAAAFERMEAVLLSLHVVSVVTVDIALLAAANYRRLRAEGVTPRGTIDTLIATRCIQEGWPLLASDRDFLPFAKHLGLNLVTA